MKRLHLLLLALLACGLFAVGCGDDDDDSGDSSDEPATTESAPADTTAEETPEPEEETEAPEEDSPAEPSDEVRQRAVEACESSIDAAAQLSEDVKGDLKEICEKAASGDEDAVREASQEVCRKIVEDSVPAGPAREQALSSCDAAGG